MGKCVHHLCTPPVLTVSENAPPSYFREDTIIAGRISTLGFVLVIFFAFGLAFEVPIATVMLVWSGLTTPEKLASNRAYIFLGAFVAGMLLTPPDIISQTLLAVPIYILYEAGIVMARIMLPDRSVDSDTDTAV